jgi:tRNA nucleotidyltransferase/poly(A) polymerase
MLPIKNFIQYHLILEAQQSLKLNVPKDVKDLHKLFKKNKRELYIVGGAVRDALLGKKPKDFDLATDAKPEEVIKILKSGGVPTIGEVGQQFGVVIAKTPSFAEGMEIATFREDIGKGRRPDSVNYSTIDKDVLRRDLTINALFYDIDKEEVVDLVGGVADIQSSTIRTVGRAQERFDEDPLRKLRALRFAGRTGSKLEKNTAEAIIKDNSLKGVSSERVRDEFQKSIVSAKSAKEYLKMVEYFKLWEVMFPNIYINKDFIDTNDWILQITQLFMKNETEEIKKKLNTMKFSNDEIDSILFLKSLLTLTPLNVLSVYKAKEISKAVDKKLIMAFSKVNKIDIKKIKGFLKFKPTVKGGQVMKQYNLKGPEIATKIKELEAENFRELI